MKLFIVSICYTNKDKGIFLSCYFFWTNIMTYIKCFLWQYSICHQIWTCPITIVLVIFLTTQNMTMLLLTTRWPIMIHQSNLRLNNQKEMNFCLCVFDPAISLYMYLCLCITHTYQGCFMRYLFQATWLLLQFTKQFQIFVLKVLRHKSNLLLVKTQCRRFGMMKREQIKEVKRIDKITFCYKINP